MTMELLGVPNYSTSDWRQDFRNHRASDWKEGFYWFLRPLFYLAARRHLSRKTLARLKPDLVLGTRGMPLCFRRRWSCDDGSLIGKTLLIQGVGSGWEVLSWAELKPRKIVGVDLYPFESWSEIRTTVVREFATDVEFHASPLHDLGSVGSNSVDVVASNACYEHVKNLPAVMQETHRILKPGGVVSAIYSPLWFCAGGDHFSGRGGLRHVFNHLLLEPEEYRGYVAKHQQQSEDFQSGVRYLELDLFSRLRTEDYLKTFRASGFEVDGLILEVSPEALAFRRKHHELFDRLLQKHPHCLEDDFLIKTNFVRLRRKQDLGGHTAIS